MFNNVADPVEFCSLLWPDVHFYKQQRDILYSVAENAETFVPAANMMGHCPRS